MNLRELSEQLGLSQTTVSRALNGYPEVNEATRKRIQDFADQHNYKPNQRAKSLATGRSMQIGHVIPFSTQHEMVNVVFSDFIAGAGEVYAKNGYDMLLSVVNDENEIGAYSELARKGSVDGVIVHGPTRDDPRIALLQDLKIPFFVHGRSSDVTTNYNHLDVNNKRAFARATEFLLDLGHTRIGLINGLERMDFAQRRRNGYEAALRDRGIAPDPAIMRSAEMTEPYGHQATAELLELEDAPTAFIASSIVPALGVRRAVEERGLTVGKDVSIICFDDAISYMPNGAGEPIFTATRSSVRDAGRRCAELLIASIQSPQAEPLSELWEAELVVGRSTGPAPKKA
ncbi:LacI family DNA-binding transcriptional regulator [uncultured Litoreibacter sp.]|uniref:LacI family DNA-binding transcriptional regulator n=1 Tax=uncultured Litoreibacter sp. TaxID=1392394 RepID=UPI00260C6D51|nr:LacI family DNA-binding transcriptional regulator [uncultured Litoreibacter sp.]